MGPGCLPMPRKSNGHSTTWNVSAPEAARVCDTGVFTRCVLVARGRRPASGTSTGNGGGNSGVGEVRRAGAAPRGFLGNGAVIRSAARRLEIGPNTARSQGKPQTRTEPEGELRGHEVLY